MFYEQIYKLIYMLVKIENRTLFTTGTSVFLLHCGRRYWNDQMRKGWVPWLKYHDIMLRQLIWLYLFIYIWPLKPPPPPLLSMQLASYSVTPAHSLPKIVFKQIYHNLIWGKQLPVNHRCFRTGPPTPPHEVVDPPIDRHYFSVM